MHSVLVSIYSLYSTLSTLLATLPLFDETNQKTNILPRLWNWKDKETIDCLQKTTGCTPEAWSRFKEAQTVTL
jgi:hypothetical protein